MRQAALSQCGPDDDANTHRRSDNAAGVATVISRPGLSNQLLPQHLVA